MIGGYVSIVGFVLVYDCCAFMMIAYARLLLFNIVMILSIWVCNSVILASSSAFLVSVVVSLVDNS